jgi:long-subunit fatty acid transport protein
MAATRSSGTRKGTSPGLVAARASLQVIVAVALAMSLAATIASAQAVPQPIMTSQYSFSNPGARSLGLGGAFVALADDATAAWANPAGLVQIAKPEVSVELRYWDYSTPFVSGGRVRGEPTGIGLDTTDGLRTVTDEYDVAGLAFLSFVYPGDRWSLSAYRHVLANLEARGETEGLFTDDAAGNPRRFFDQVNTSQLEITSYGLSGAYRLSDAFSIGVGLVYYQTSFAIQSDLYLWDDLDDPFGSGTSFLPEHFVIGQTLHGDDSSVGFSAGLLWRINRWWSFGGRFREGPVTRLRGSVQVGSILDVGAPPGFEGDFEVAEDVELPDNYGLGVAYRSADGRLTVGFEWDRVTYSDSLESLQLDDQLIDDADQFHLGGEWVFLETRPLLAIRAGVWHDPDHQTRANEDADDHTRALLTPGEDQLHYALGFGLAFKDFQIDAALDFSDTVNTASLSLVYSF